MTQYAKDIFEWLILDAYRHLSFIRKVHIHFN